MLDRILPVEDEEVSAFVAKDFARQGMTILTGHRTTALDVKPGRGVVATLSGPGGAREPRDFSHVIVAVGIVPNTENIGLETLGRSEEHTSELQSLMRISYAVFCLKTKKQQHIQKN